MGSSWICHWPVTQIILHLSQIDGRSLNDSVIAHLRDPARLRVESPSSSARFNLICHTYLSHLPSVSPQSKQQILQPLTIVRPKFRVRAYLLYDLISISLAWPRSSLSARPIRPTRLLSHKVYEQRTLIDPILNPLFPRLFAAYLTFAHTYLSINQSTLIHHPSSAGDRSISH